jgi:hypothetical protein
MSFKERALDFTAEWSGRLGPVSLVGCTGLG